MEGKWRMSKNSKNGFSGVFKLWHKVILSLDDFFIIFWCFFFCFLSFRWWMECYIYRELVKQIWINIWHYSMDIDQKPKRWLKVQVALCSSIVASWHFLAFFSWLDKLPLVFIMDIITCWRSFDPKALFM